jgi:hypothetical protein
MGVTALWLGCAITVALLVYRGYSLRRDHARAVHAKTNLSLDSRVPRNKAALGTQSLTDSDAAQILNGPKASEAAQISPSASPGVNSPAPLPEKEHTVQKAPYSVLLALAPFIAAVLFAIVWPSFMVMNFQADNAAFIASKMSSAEWVAMRSNDNRTARSTFTSVLCACLIAGAGVFTTRWTFSMAQRK